MDTIVRPNDNAPFFQPANLYVQAQRTPAECERVSEDIVWQSHGDVPVTKPPDKDNPWRKKDFPLRKPADNAPVEKLLDYPVIERQNAAGTT